MIDTNNPLKVFLFPQCLVTGFFAAEGAVMVILTVLDLMILNQIPLIENCILEAIIKLHGTMFSWINSIIA
jgi:hypothetical protein